MARHLGASGAHGLCQWRGSCFHRKGTGLFAAIIAVLLVAFVSASSEAVVGKRPDAPLSSIRDFDPNWVELHVFKGFNINNQKHVDRATSLADYVCELYNRTAILLTLTQPNNFRLISKQGLVSSGHVDLYYTFACAIE